MSGNSVLLDTNIVLYLLSGDKVLAELLYQKNFTCHSLISLNCWVSGELLKNNMLRLDDSSKSVL